MLGETGGAVHEEMLLARPEQYGMMYCCLTNTVCTAEHPHHDAHSKPGRQGLSTHAPSLRWKAFHLHDYQYYMWTQAKHVQQKEAAKGSRKANRGRPGDEHAVL